MTPYSDFLPYVLPYVMGCSSTMAEQVLRDVCIDFCAQTLLIQQTLDPVSTIAGLDTYDLDVVTPGTAIHVITQAWFKRQKLEVLHGDSPRIHPEQYNAAFPGANIVGGTPRALTQNRNVSFTLDRPALASEAQAITLRVALKPTRDSTTVDDLLMADYAFEIGQGVVGRLMRIPNQPFSNQGGAIEYDRAYMAARHSGRIRANKAFGRSVLQVQLRGF